MGRLQNMQPSRAVPKDRHPQQNCSTPTPFRRAAALAQQPREAWRGRSPSNNNPQGQLRRPEDSDFCAGSEAQRRRPEQIIATLQFEVDLPLANQSRLWRDASAQIKDLRRCALRPEIPAGISAKTVNLLPIRLQLDVSTKPAYAITPTNRSK